MDKKEDKRNHKIPNLMTKPFTAALSIACLLFMTSAVLSPTLISIAPIASKMAFAQHQQTPANQTNITSTSSTTSDTYGGKIILDEVKEPYMPCSIIILGGDKVRWINTDAEVHTVTSGFENFLTEASNLIQVY